MKRNEECMNNDKLKINLAFYIDNVNDDDLIFLKFLKVDQLKKDLKNDCSFTTEARVFRDIEHNLDS